MTSNPKTHRCTSTLRRLDCKSEDCCHVSIAGTRVKSFVPTCVGLAVNHNAKAATCVAFIATCR